ncbi:HNH endonuclease [Agromyces endophyticus]|uniref:HNH endonuclease signature motif containing protein n=1 Tax=Agromyces sp. H17E-10 TaxID=2932244 RepID=UPI001FD04C7B|nr:HNH endonuclease signature motif containing protein [Agromyces sp. H17E-10]UOQ88480.1 HNH endonuclease [Agromyces sp. H17E-10]
MPEPAGIPALTGVSAALDQVCSVWAGAVLAGVVGSTLAAADVRVMSDEGLVRVTEALGELSRRVQALQAPIAAELAARSRPGTDEVARKHGYATAERLIATATGSRHTDAAKLVAVGQATAPRASFTGELLPPRHPHLADALASGTICVDAAEVIRRFLDRVAPRADRAELADAERFLVEQAPTVGVDGLHRLVKLLEARLDPDGVKPREDELRAARGLRFWEDRAGMLQLRGAFDPVNGAPIKLALETLVAAQLHQARGSNQPGDSGATGSCHDATPTDAVAAGDAIEGTRSGAGTNRSMSPVAGDRPDQVFIEDRTIVQMNADALADIARTALSAEHAPAPLRQTMVIARVDADMLTTGHGHGTIDGIDQPISIQSVRELAMHAGIAPIYLDEHGENLQLGRHRRLFTHAQKLALIERDGGCAWPGCTRPPSHTQAHHLRWWRRHHGRTDVSNGVMLCAHHHHRIHDDGWLIFNINGYVWFIPPAHLDPDRRPRPGNRRIPTTLPPPPDVRTLLTEYAAA